MEEELEKKKGGEEEAYFVKGDSSGPTFGGLYR